MEKSRNYFTLFAIPTSFELDLTGLTARYLTLQKAVHPDKFANSSEQERLYSVQQTAQLNDAYVILKKPLLRAEYLLKLNGVDLNKEKNTIKDVAFLMQQLELRESIEKSKADVDALDDALDHVDAQFNSQLKILSQQFSEDEPAYEKIADLVRKLQFFNKLRIEIDELTSQLN